MKPGRVRVAIIGGGCAGITTAFELTRPEHNGKYDVTVYQVGWRLGGKGASGRGPADRIEEHGLHLWMGFYENAFRLLRECYAELGRDPKKCRIADWRDAFVPDNLCGVMDRSPGGWLPWMTQFPPTPGSPGDPDATTQRWTVVDYLTRSVTLLRTVFEAVQTRTGTLSTSETGAGPFPDSPSDVAGTVARLMKYGQIATLGALLESIRMLDNIVRTLPNYPTQLILRFHDAIATAARSQLEAIIDRDNEARRLWEIADLVLAVIRGIINDRLATDPRGFDAINDHDCRDWLRLNGASERSVNSAFLRALYDLAFAYEDGDVTRPRIAAGQAVRGAVRAFFTYRGAFFWKMTSGMGDVVFAPFYEVLRRRGVRFEFFHRLKNVSLGRGRKHVDALEFDVQARTRSGREYSPLIDVRGLPCWPSGPRWAQLDNGARMRREGWNFESHWENRRIGEKTLRVSKDFDLVVLGVGVAAIPHVGKELIAESPRWRAMADHCKSVPTQAFQIWLSESMERLGWRGGQTNVSGFVEPFDTWADMRQLVSEETWKTPVAAIAYFCSVLPDAEPGVDTSRPNYPGERRDEARQNAVRFLNTEVQHLWPASSRRPGEFRWDVLVDPAAPGRKRAATGEARFGSQYWTANVNPSDRYSLSLPGTLKHRISPLDDSFDNLTVAGDWTDCGFNEGCVEAAVMSGRLAAHALSKSPSLADITGFDHP